MRFLPVGILLVLFSACLDEPDCIVTATNEVYVDLRKPNVDSAQTIIFQQILISGTDSVFHKNDTTSELTLRINPNAPQTTFRFYYGTEFDSLVVAYTMTTKLISPKCGAFNYFQDLSVVSTSFQQVIVSNPQLTSGGSTNITIKL